MEWETQVKWKDLGATSSTRLDSSHCEDLMLDLGPRAAAIMAIKSPSSDKESCKSNPILAHGHMLAVIQLHINNLMSLSVFIEMILYHHLSEKTEITQSLSLIFLTNAPN